MAFRVSQGPPCRCAPPVSQWHTRPNAHTFLHLAWLLFLKSPQTASLLGRYMPPLERVPGIVMEHTALYVSVPVCTIVCIDKFQGQAETNSIQCNCTIVKTTGSLARYLGSDGFWLLSPCITFYFNAQISEPFFRYQHLQNRAPMPNVSFTVPVCLPACQPGKPSNLSDYRSWLLLNTTVQVYEGAT